MATWWSTAIAVASFLNLSQSPLRATKIDCLSNPTLEKAISCFDKYTVPKQFYDQQKYDAAQPTDLELVAWEQIIRSLLFVDANCTSIAVPSTLSNIYSLLLFTEQDGLSYCVLSETTATGSSYSKGWGLVVVPATREAVQRHIHLSAPHPQYDWGTPQQAAALFRAVGAKSLLIPGRSRKAFLRPTTCITSSKDTYYTTDPAHATSEPYFSASRAIHSWQNSVGGCPSSSCAYIQMHGKAAKTCPTDQIFLSSGLANSSKSYDWYTRNANLPISRLQKNLRTAFRSKHWNISLPSESSCRLAATTNVVGRLINGISEAEVCVKGSNVDLATGEFIHIEQAAVSLTESGGVYSLWAQALNATFAVVHEDQ